MKKLLLLTAALLTKMVVMAQTMNVQVGQVTYQVPASQAGEMVYDNAQTLTINNKVSIGP